jgi:hypothetical protein
VPIIAAIVTRCAFSVSERNAPAWHAPMPLMGGADAAARGTIGPRARAAARARASALARSATGGAWIDASDEADAIVTEVS